PPPLAQVVCHSARATRTPGTSLLSSELSLRFPARPTAFATPPLGLSPCHRRTPLLRASLEQTSRAAQCEREKGSDRPPTDMKAGREGPVSGREEVTGRAVILPIQRKIA